MIVQNVATDGHDRGQLHRRRGRPGRDPRASAEAAAKAIGASGVTHDAEVAKVSVVGLGMRTHTGVATTMFEALAEAGINIEMITTSEIKISVLVERARPRPGRSGPSTGRSSSTSRSTSSPEPAFPTERSPTQAAPQAAAGDRRPSRHDGPAGMEDLVDLGRRARRGPGADHPVRRPRPARLRRPGLPRDRRGGRLRRHDRPERQHGGQDAPLVHRPPRRGRARRGGGREAVGPGEVSVEPALAKLSVLGVGMRTHTGVATRMFGALAERGINIALINTSEVRINVATDLDRGPRGAGVPRARRSRSRPEG